MSTPLRVLALVKQIPEVQALQLDGQGRLDRDGVGLAMNDYCRRAVAKGLELARATGGSLTVATMGPPAAADVLREAVTFGADEALLLTDPAFAGSDSLVTARALAGLVRTRGPFDLILTGRTALDAETGQVPPALAHLLHLPFAAGVRHVQLHGDRLDLVLEHDDRSVTARTTLPAVLSCAERLCDPCKIKDPAGWVDADDPRISVVGAASLGPGRWGSAGSPTSVGAVRVVEVRRERRVVADRGSELGWVGAVVRRRQQGRPSADSGLIWSARPRPRGPVVAVVLEPGRPGCGRELLGEGARLATLLGGACVGFGSDLEPEIGSRWGADRMVLVSGASVEEDLAAALAAWAAGAEGTDLAAVIGPATDWGREVLARSATELGAGMTGDAVELEVRDGRVAAWKPALGGQALVEIECRSPIHFVSVRPGVLPLRGARPTRPVPVEALEAGAASRMVVLTRVREDDLELARAHAVIGIGMGVEQADHPLVVALAERLDAAVCATRKVTDRQWMPRARQVGITGHSLAPSLFISVGASGSFHHTVGFRNAGTVIAINTDPAAPIFGCCDVGLVGDWKAVLPRVVDAVLAAPGAAHPAVPGPIEASSR